MMRTACLHVILSTLFETEPKKAFLLKKSRLNISPSVGSKLSFSKKKKG